ncbi:MAG: DUF5710 domain-containing protein [Coriobacteriia bacterium]|nr:DUF5710 domain-containing protein [Coriobacteriia bacterium]
MISRIDLCVPYKEKDEAKALGARWDPVGKTWYIPKGLKPDDFEQWLPQPTPDHLYLIAGWKTCFKCNKQTPVCGFALKFSDVDEYKEGIHILCPEEIDCSSLPSEITQVFVGVINLKQGFSRITNSSTYANHCVHCKTLQGNYYVFYEAEPPFFVDSKEAARKLLLFELPGVLKNGIKGDFDACSFGFPIDLLIEEYTPRSLSLNDFRLAFSQTIEQ